MKKQQSILRKGILHEKWNDYTADEINLIKYEQCVGCKYCSGLSEKCKAYVSNLTCNYLVLTGKRRVTRPEICDKKVELSEEIVAFRKSRLNPIIRPTRERIPGNVKRPRCDA